MSLVNLDLLRNLHDRIYTRFEFKPNFERAARLAHLQRIHYACGRNLMKGWLNVDLRPENRIPPELRDFYLKMSLARAQPFADERFRFGFSEDFIEHLSQADSLVFLAEAFRTLARDGVLRISTPGLPGVLRRHYRESCFSGATVGMREAYTPHGHLHFYCRESLELVARHLGFRKVEVRGFGESEYPELRGLETRTGQVDLNLIVELTR